MSLGTAKLTAPGRLLLVERIECDGRRARAPRSKPGSASCGAGRIGWPVGSRWPGRIPDGGGWRVHGRQERPAMKRGKGYDYLHVAVDDHSGIAFVQTHHDGRGATCANFIADAFAFFDELGITVDRVMTGNAKNYNWKRAHNSLGNHPPASQLPSTT